MIDVKRICMLLSISILAGLCLVPALAAEKVAFSTVAPAADLVAEVKAKVEALEKALADQGSYQMAKAKAIPQDAKVLAVLAQALAVDDESSPLKASAADLRDTAVALAAAGSYDAAKQAFDKVKAAANGTASGSAKADAEWPSLIDLDNMMKEVQARSNKLRRYVRKLPDDIDAASRDASVLAVLGVALAADTHEVKNKADVPKWEEYCESFRTKMSETAAALKQKDAAKAAEAFKQGSAACNKCHTAFRDDK